MISGFFQLISGFQIFSAIPGQIRINPDGWQHCSSMWSTVNSMTILLFICSEICGNLLLSHKYCSYCLFVVVVCWLVPHEMIPIGSLGFTVGRGKAGSSSISLSLLLSIIICTASLKLMVLIFTTQLLYCFTAEWGSWISAAG